MRTAAERCAAMDGGPDDPTFDELAERVGAPFRMPDVGERCGSPELDVARYWPAVPADLAP